MHSLGSIDLDWRVEFIDPPRYPRPGLAEVTRLLLRSLDAKVLFRERRNYTDIVLRFPCSFQQLPQHSRTAYSHLGMSLEDVFSEDLWKKPSKGSSTLWAELFRTGYSAYRETWLSFLKLIYLNHSHPNADKLLRKQLEKLSNETKRLVGRREARDEEIQSRRRRFRQLKAECTDIHRLVEDRAKNNSAESAIRRAVFERIRGKRIDDPVLRRKESAFEDIPYGKRNTVTCLHNPESWQPDQLAKALLARERGCTYQTIEKETAVPRRSSRSKSK
jgi:hypothetical protein